MILGYNWLNMKENKDTIKNYQRNVDFSYKEMSKKIEYIRRSLSLANTKVTFLSALVGVILAFYIPLFLSNFQKYPIFYCQYWIQILSLLLSVLSLICLLYVAIPKRFNDPAKAEWLCSKKTLNLDHYKMKYDFMLGMKNIYKESVKNHEKNILWLKRSIMLIFISIVFILSNIWLWQTTKTLKQNQLPMIQVWSQIHHRN